MLNLFNLDKKRKKGFNYDAENTVKKFVEYLYFSPSVITTRPRAHFCRVGNIVSILVIYYQDTLINNNYRIEVILFFLKYYFKILKS